jgi:NAD(P)-dependent dehydrogenase (short-subunit alcohol dehydrogenase family)
VFQADGYRVIATDLDPTHDDQDAFIDIDLYRFCADPPYRTESLQGLRGAIEGPGLDVLINNAAVQVLRGTTELSYSDWQQTLNINLIAPFLLTQGLLQDLELGRGSVINIGSVHGELTKPGFVAYATSKSAIAGLTRAMAVDLGPQLRVNTISPAATSTPMLRAGFEGRSEALRALGAVHPLGRIAEPEEIARVALFVASPAASFMSGCNVPVTGGISSRLHDPD